MRLSQSLFKTERSIPSDAQRVSHQLLIRAGLVRQISSGIYSLTPLAVRALHNIVAIAKEEMNRVGGQEVLLPVVHPASLWEQSGRYDKIDDSLVRFADRNHHDMVLAMTHEEAVTDLARHFVQSYRQLPMMLYQVQMKFRDEPRPRGGLIRLREFLMKDAYSFHATDEDLDEFYAQMMIAYERFFRRCGIRALCVEADTGMMGGGTSHEYMVLSDGGEDTLLTCQQCGYAANREVATSAKTAVSEMEAPFWKLFVDSTGEIIAVGIPHGRAVNDVKLARAVGAAEVREVTKNEAAQLELPTHGWLDSAESIQRSLSIIVDDSFAAHPMCADVRYRLTDIILSESGDRCNHCGNRLESVRGIEVGNIFKLGTCYSQPMHAGFTAQDGSTQPFIMGCYGIGITRLLASIIEDNHDERGIIFPASIAPFKYHLVQIGADAEVADAAERVYAELGPEQVLFDDRNLPAGAKFADADLFGMPYRLTVSKKSLTSGSVELKARKTSETAMIPMHDLDAIHRASI